MAFDYILKGFGWLIGIVIAFGFLSIMIDAFLKLMAVAFASFTGVIALAIIIGYICYINRERIKGLREKFKK